MISKFATEEEVFSSDFNTINKDLLSINKEYNLIDHTELNKTRFRWADKITSKPSFYAARMWEYPFVILSAELKNGLKCADIGCGTTPFTIYLAKHVGSENVTGFDPDLILDDADSHYAFGIRKNFIEKIGINFKQNYLNKLDCADNYFDRVFCISVLEHITEPEIWQNGLREMARILKPGGRLILTVDLGIQNPLTNPIDIIKYSGLLPFGEIDFSWPLNRFVNMNESTMDVFGLILWKDDNKIYADYNSTEEIDAYKVQNTFKADIYSSSELQIIKDLRRKLGFFRFSLKKVLGKYK